MKILVYRRRDHTSPACVLDDDDFIWEVLSLPHGDAFVALRGKNKEALLARLRALILEEIANE